MATRFIRPLVDTPIHRMSPEVRVKVARSSVHGQESPAVEATDGRWLDISAITQDVDGAFLAGGGLAEVRDRIDTLPPLTEPVSRFGPPVAKPGKIICIGVNYWDHAAEASLTVPTEPVLFMKAPDTVVGPTDDVLIPRRSNKTDYEVELAVVIGTTAR